MRRGLPARRRRPAFVLSLGVVLARAWVLKGWGGGGDAEHTAVSAARVPAGTGAASPDSAAPGGESAYLAGTLTADEGVTVGEASEVPEAGELKPQAPRETATPPPAVTRPATSASADAGAFNLQLGSFTNLDNARRQADRIRALGYEPVVEASELGGQTYHRVMLKRVGDMAAASRLGEHIHSELGIAYLVRRAN